MTATYTTSGIGSLIFNIDGNDSVPLGARNEANEPDVEITKWEFDRQREFVGFQTWQTPTTIRAISMITLNNTCVEEINAAAVIPDPIPDDTTPIDDNENNDETKEDEENE